MNAGMIEPRHWVLAIFVASALYVHFRGTVRFSLVRALTDFTVLLAPVNAVMYLFSRTRRTAYIDPTEFPELAPLQANWQIIRDEAMALADGGQIRAASGYNDIGFNSFFRTGWKRFYLSWYGRELPSAMQSCPKTLALLKQIPTVKAAMFASLPPGATLVRHRDPSLITGETARLSCLTRPSFITPPTPLTISAWCSFAISSVRYGRRRHAGSIGCLRSM